jgi:hypothetical protein
MGSPDVMRDLQRQATGNNYGRATEVRPATETEAQEFFTEANKELDTDWTWEDALGYIEDFQSMYTANIRYALSLTGLDGIAFDFAVSADGGLLVGGEVSTGISVFFPLHSKYDPADDPKADEDTPHPIDDAPHYFTFTAQGVSVGFQAGVGAGVEGALVLADHWEEPEDITRDSWAGSVGSFNLDAGVSVGMGFDASATLYFTSVATESTGPDGTLTWSIPEQGWHGAGVALSVGGGLEAELSVGLSFTNASESFITFRNAAVKNYVENREPTEIPESGDFHYQTPDKGPGFIHSIIEGMTGQ